MFHGGGAWRLGAGAADCAGAAGAVGRGRGIGGGVGELEERGWDDGTVGWVVGSWCLGGLGGGGEGAHGLWRDALERPGGGGAAGGGGGEVLGAIVGCQVAFGVEEVVFGVGTAAGGRGVVIVVHDRGR